MAGVLVSVAIIRLDNVFTLTSGTCTLWVDFSLFTGFGRAFDELIFGADPTENADELQTKQFVGSRIVFEKKKRLNRPLVIATISTSRKQPITTSTIPI